MDWVGLACIGKAGLDWFGMQGNALECTGLDWVGLDWNSLQWIGMGWIGLDCIGMRPTLSRVEREQIELKAENKEIEEVQNRQSILSNKKVSNSPVAKKGVRGSMSPSKDHNARKV